MHFCFILKFVVKAECWNYSVSLHQVGAYRLALAPAYLNVLAGVDLLAGSLYGLSHVARVMY